MTQTRMIVDTALARPRARRLQIAPTVQPVATPEPEAALVRMDGEDMQALEALAADYFVHNTASNAESRMATAAKKALHKLMVSKGVTEFQVTVASPDGDASLVQAEISAPPTDVIDVAALRDLVDEATFLKIVSATKTAVESHAGTNVLAAVLKTVPGKQDLRIKAVKV